jgi:hypothetical protein
LSQVCVTIFLNFICEIGQLLADSAATLSIVF